MPHRFAEAVAVMYRGNSELHRQRITEWHQQGSSRGRKHRDLGLIARVAFFALVANICFDEIKTKRLLLLGIAAYFRISAV